MCAPGVSHVTQGHPHCTRWVGDSMAPTTKRSRSFFLLSAASHIQACEHGSGLPRWSARPPSNAPRNSWHTLLVQVTQLILCCSADDQLYFDTKPQTRHDQRSDEFDLRGRVTIWCFHNFDEARVSLTCALQLWNVQTVLRPHCLYHSRR